MDNNEAVTPPNSRPKIRESWSAKKMSPDGSRRLLISPVKRLSALRLVSPIDSDQELNDLEVASVLGEGSSISPTKPKRHETPVRPATVMTNVQRGNVQTTTPIFQNITIHQMSAQGELNMLKQAVEQGADLNKVDEYGLTPILWACSNGQLLTVQYLLDMKVNKDIPGNHGENALLFASCYGYTDIVKMLLKLGMDVDYVDETGSTGLMYAAYNNHCSCVKALLEYGADLTIQNDDCYTAMELAVGQGNKAVQYTMDTHMLSLLDSMT